MDAGQIGELRAWASRLEQRTDDDELRAAAKAILMLADEVEELQARLVVASAQAPPVEEPAGTGTVSEPPPRATGCDAAPNLVARIRRAFGLE